MTMAVKAASRARETGYEDLKKEHVDAWKQRWAACDVTIEGDDAAQQGIRFNLFQLLSTYSGEDARLNIGPKGFTGEKYGGATYWDTEAYCLPVYMAVAGPGRGPSAASATAICSWTARISTPSSRA